MNVQSGSLWARRALLTTEPRPRWYVASVPVWKNRRVTTYTPRFYKAPFKYSRQNKSNHVPSKAAGQGPVVSRPLVYGEFLKKHLMPEGSWHEGRVASCVRIDLEPSVAPCLFLTVSFGIIEQLCLQGDTADNGSSTSIIYHLTLLSVFVLASSRLFVFLALMLTAACVFCF